MDFCPTGAWLLVFHLAAFVPARTLDVSMGGEALRSGQIRREGEPTHPLVDVASPRVVTGDAASPRSTPFLGFVEKTRNRGEVRYNVTAFGEVYQFVLRPERRFIAPSFTVEHFSGNQSISVPCGSDLSHCYYRGHVLDDPVSSAVFDLCNGMRGAFKTRNGIYLVQPLVQNSTQDPDDRKRHLITKHLATLSHVRNGSHCGVEESILVNRTKPNNEHSSGSQNAFPKVPDSIHRRAKRETIFQGVRSYPRYVELMFTADRSMLDHYGSEFELKRYLQTTIGVVHDIFRNPKIGNSIEIVLIGIKILKNDEDLRITSDARTSLTRFCVWQHKQNVVSDSEPGHYDTAVLITRKNICRSKGHCETLGLAELGTMCNPKRSCSIVEDNGLGVAFTIAHELGHVFNIGHDVTSKYCLGETNGLRVMAPSLNLQAMPWSWSSCSRQEITEFFEQGRDKCLMDKPQYQYKRSDKLPGEVYSPEMQCKLTYGKHSTLCRLKTNDSSCRRLWCRLDFSDGHEGCHTRNMPWAEGSPCGEGKWCIHGTCVKKQTSRTVDGAWSPWTRFTPCSRSCGGGVTFSSRRCNNPSPTQGGRFCHGAKKRFKSCRTHDCPEGSPNFREVQCAAFNGKRGSRGSKWIPRYHQGRHQCQLICERVGGGDFVTAKVIDGTKCTEKKFDICVNGICRLAGCDNVLNSRTKIDDCGVCGGRNTSCERNTETWHHKVKWGYNPVTTLLPGYSSIRIEQTTPEDENKHGDDNYLVLLDEKERSIINGHYRINSESKLTIEALGLKITYSGSKSYPEYIKIDGRLKNKLYVQVLSVAKVVAPKIVYSYNAPVTDLPRYVWDRIGPWSRCSHECQGLKTRKLICKRERDGLLVSPQRCDPKKKPATVRGHCNNHCVFRWVTAGKGSCQPGCGPGSQKIYFRCVKQEIRSRRNVVRSGKDCKHITRPRAEQPCNGRCDNIHWLYSKWSKCSKTCGNGLQTRRATCVEVIANGRKELSESTCSQIEKRSLRRACNTARCPSWRTGKWSRCSVACGEGDQEREVACVWRGSRRARDSMCDLRKKPKKKQHCRMKACPHWEYDEWSDCSVTCGIGHQIRLLRCVDADRRALREEECRTVQKPVSRRECEGMPQCDKTVFLISKFIKPEVRWITGEWGECYARCGTGHQKRQLRCEDLKGRVQQTSRCENVSKPLTVQSCVKYCGNWRYSDWTPCSSGCGRGTQRRQVKCFSRHRLTEDDMCDPLFRPPNIRQCTNYLCSPAKQVKPATNGRWKTGSWNECSSGCGRGTQSRQVKCFTRDGFTEDRMCNPLTRPPYVRQCFNTVCLPGKKVKPKTNGRWKTGSWTKCSKTCESGVKRRSVTCMNGYSRRDLTERSCKKIAKPAAITPCNLGLCPRWRTKQWSRCSKSCDLGTVTREVYCSDNKSILREEKCNRKLKPAAKKSCLVKKCVMNARWVKGDWNPCSVKCGEGIKGRKLWCEDLNGKRIPTMQCNKLRRKPKSLKKCRRSHCGLWEAGPWGACSSKCDIGEKARSVRCIKDSSYVGDEFCSSKNKLLDKKPCRVADCKPGRGQYKWFMTDWNPCTTTCGAGVKSRMVLCVNEKEIQVGKSNCSSDTQPPATMACKKKECLIEWVVRDWSECSKSCGRGIQMRLVTCPKKVDQLVQQREQKRKNDLCDKEKKPASKRQCNHGVCNNYYTWKTGQWTRCSTTCGEGTKRRAVECRGRNNVNSPDAWCLMAGTNKPDSVSKCMLQQCLPKSCRDIQAQNGKQNDKEFVLAINNKKIKVFCQGMLTDNPKEFITLSSGPNSNFAEYYHRILKNPNQCPYNGARSDNCPHCHSERFSRSGGTYFSKVRFDISRMALIGNDFSFTVRRGQNSQMFGSAGDCYSKMQCPQGRFSIDLTNTGLSLASEVTWKSYGHNLSKVINIKEGRQIVTGKCGGYCGACRPYRWLRVTV